MSWIPKTGGMPLGKNDSTWMRDRARMRVVCNAFEVASSQFEPLSGFDETGSDFKVMKLVQVMSKDSEYRLLNVEVANDLIDNHSDPFVRSMLRLVDSYLTWEILECHNPPDGDFDLGFCMYLLSKALTSENVAERLSNPDPSAKQTDFF